jgi:hypothetical protein
MWRNVWIEPAAAGETPVERDSTVGVELGTAPGGSNASDGALVDPRTITFLRDLHSRFSWARFGTYRGHGSAGFGGRGLSIDVTMSGRDRAAGRDYAAETSRDWYERTNVADLLDAIDASAAALGYRFFAIYNDFAVARYANSRLHNGNVGFAANIDRGGGVNYHGGGYKLPSISTWFRRPSSPPTIRGDDQLHPQPHRSDDPRDHSVRGYWARDSGQQRRLRKVRRPATSLGESRV